MPRCPRAASLFRLEAAAMYRSTWVYAHLWDERIRGSTYEPEKQVSRFLDHSSLAITTRRLSG